MIMFVESNLLREWRDVPLRVQELMVQYSAGCNFLRHVSGRIASVLLKSLKNKYKKEWHGRC